MPNLISTNGAKLDFTPQVNRLMGRVIWMQNGLHGLTLKLRVGNTLNLKIHSNTQAMENTSYSLGQWLVVNIPQESVFLLPSGGHLSKNGGPAGKAESSSLLASRTTRVSSARQPSR